jgi:uncharacterized protein YeaO (DUF488 family)
MPLKVKRVYASVHPDDGMRILVDRLWPRGLTKEDAAIDQWVRECAPSDDLRKWFGHDRAKWDAFKQRYFRELGSKEELLASTRALARKKRVTLLFAASDLECNNAIALMEYLGTYKRTPKSRRTRKPTPGSTVQQRRRKRRAADAGARTSKRTHRTST